MLEEPPSDETEDLEFLHVLLPALVDAVMADVDESLRDEDRFESDEGFLVTVHEFLRRPAMRSGRPHPIALTESERDELKLSDDTDSARRCLPRWARCFCWISAIRYAYSFADESPSSPSVALMRRNRARIGERIQPKRLAGRRSYRCRWWWWWFDEDDDEFFSSLSRPLAWHWQLLPSFDELRSPRLFVLPGVWRLLKLELWRHLPMPRVTRDSSIALQIMTQSFLNCFVRMAYRNGLQHELSGRMNTVKILASSSEMKRKPDAAVSEKNAMGAQQRKSVNTSSAMRLAMRESFEFHACEPRIAQYICPERDGDGDGDGETLTNQPEPNSIPSNSSPSG